MEKELSTEVNPSVLSDEPTSILPAPSSIVLPPTFANSMWTQDYRTGFEGLYNSLEAGLIESTELLKFLEQRATSERSFAVAILPSELKEDGFGSHEGASLRMGFESLLGATVQEGRARLALSNDLERNIVMPFEKWSQEHQGRIKSSKIVVSNHLGSYEKKSVDVIKLKLNYAEAVRIADSSEDELNFHSLKRDRPSPPPASIPIEEPLEPIEIEEKGIDDAGEGDDGMIGRSGATGGSITAALGRALSSRRRSSASTKELPFTPDAAAALDWSKNTFTSLLERVNGPSTIEGKNEKARKDAEIAEERYKVGVESLDQLRLTLEESLFEHYSYTQRCEIDRLKAATSVLRSYHASVASIPKLLLTSNERAGAALELVRPEKDLLAIIERSRTGPFRPMPVVYHSHYSEPAIHNFGLDLRKFDETNPSPEIQVPTILTFLLDYITESYTTLSDSERRKAWLYETSLAAQHQLRSALNDPNHFDRSTLTKYDLPVVVSTLKLWLLELDVPLIIPYESYRTLYPKRVGAEVVEVKAEAIAELISKLPRAHLATLKAIVHHVVDLVKNTKTEEESDEVYLQKLSLALSRCIMRPKQDTSLTLDDRFPALLFLDLVKSYSQIFEQVTQLSINTREDRYKPRRARTKPVDVRISRSNLDPETLLRQQRGILASPPLPPLPPTIVSTIKLPPLPPSTPTQESNTATTISPSSSAGSPSRGRVTRGPRPLPGAPLVEAEIEAPIETSSVVVEALEQKAEEIEKETEGA